MTTRTAFGAATEVAAPTHPAPLPRLVRRLAGEGISWVVVAAGIAVLVAWPIGRLLYEAVRTPGVFHQIWADPEILRAIRGTVVTSLGATAMALLVGGGAAIAFWRLRVAGQQWLTAGLLLPVLVPPFVSALSVTQAYTAAGLLDHLLGIRADWLFGPAGTTLVLGVQQVPIAFLVLAAAIRTRGGADAERAARAAGANPLTCLFTITLPLLRPALLAASALCFIAAASDFGVPAVLAIPARYPTVTTEIYRAMSFSSSGLASPVALSTLLIVVALVVFAVAGRLTNRITATGRHSSPLVVRGRPWHGVVSVVLAGYLLVANVIPFLGLLSVALTRVYGESPVPAHWGLDHLREAVSGAAGGALARSALLSLAAASVLCVAGVLAGSVALRRGGRIVSTLIAIPYAVPGSAVAVAILLAFGRWFYGGLVIIELAYLARFWALAQQPIGAALSHIGPDPMRAARACGASAWRAWWTAIWPSIRPSVFAGWLLVFLTCLHELTVSSLLYVPGKETIGVVVLNAELAGDLAATSAIALVLTLVVLACAVPLFLSRRLRGALGFSAGGMW
ncbi:MAG: iron ABC transporter permease [Acidothermus sp.]|nr:iron ABC transporter permease [Acidothermus sp.]MCL6538129.1 ABC transporter permease subunit [Acidothermus sp.]